MQNIKRLPRNVHGSLRSGVVMFDLPRVVEELVNNSLDANPTKVSVFVNVRTCYIKIEDDGCGITRDELVILGEKYATSKSGLVDDGRSSTHGLGFRGEALLSLSNISIVEVRTKARGKPNAYCKIIKAFGSKCLFLGIDDQREGVGTTVIVRDLFYNQPVRRRYMQSSSKKVLYCVKKVVLRAALVHSQVSFKLVDIDSEEELICTTPSSSPLPYVSNMFSNEVSDSLHEIVFSDDMLMLSGYISGPGDVCPTKALQYLYVNLRFISKGPIHNMLNNLASSVLCSLALHAVDPEIQGGKRHKIQANPAFILNLHCPTSLYDLHFEPSKTIIEFKDWDSVLTFFERAVRQSWQQHLATSLQGSSQKIGALRKSEAQKEETSTRDLVKSSSITKRSSNNQLHRNSLNIPMATPLDLASEDTDAAQDQGKSKRDLHGFLMNLEPCQTDTDYFGEYNSLYCSANNTVHLLGSSPDNMSCLDIDHYDNADDYYFGEYNSLRCSANDAGHLLESSPDNMSCLDIDHYENAGDYFLPQNHVILDPVPQFGKKNNILGSKWKNKCPERVGNLSREAVKTANARDFLGVMINDHEVEFSSPFLKKLSKSGANSCSLIKNDHCDSAYYSRHSGYDVRIGQSGSDFFLHDNIDCMDADCSTENLDTRDTYTQELIDASIHSIGVIRKCQTTKHLDVSSIDLVDPCSLDQGCSSKDKRLDSCLQDWEASSRCGSPYPCAWHARSLRTIFDPANRSISEEKLMSVEGDGTWPLGITEVKDEYLSPTQRWSTWEPPSMICPANNLDDNCSLHPISNTDISYPSDEVAFENVCSSSKINDQISLFPSDILDISVTEKIFNPELHAIEKDNVVVGSLCNEKEFQSQQLPLIYKERSRSQSAPPFYKGKSKFSVLCGCRTSVVAKNSSSAISKDLSEAVCLLDNMLQPNACQPCSQPVPSEDFQPYMIEPSNEKPSTFDKRHYGQADAIDDVPEYSASGLAKWRLGIPQTKDEDILHKPVEQTNDILDISSGLLHISGDSLVPELINKDCLHNARVLYQLDKKFIPVMANGRLMIIDQHAADERIRVEELRRQVLSGEGRRVTYLESEQELVLPEMGFQLLQKYSEKIQNWGWIFNIHSASQNLFNKNLNLLKRHSSGVILVAVPCILGINLNDKDLLEFIQQLVETDGSSTLPPSVLRILNFKACRGAIMFGDSLLPSECSLIVEELKATSLCFQCAHGRPTTVPLLNMASLHEQLAKLKVDKGGSSETWHGLRVHRRPSIRRAQLLLDSAKRFHNG
ncbi:unnamed protein product [Musa textilis]